ncbi:MULTISPECIES: AraC family transcriptional regulator N-terminal domain-containing protein [unclassified Inquilinus]|uniref:AraC family transcriptional regulator n=1 Tax=unclassified Inquilinus TaxID=2645927 RepID=UPI003F91E290
MEPLAELRSLITRHAVPGSMATALPGVRVMASPITTEPVQHISEPAFGVIVQGAKRTVLGGRVFEYGAGQHMVVSLDLPLTGHVTRASAEEPFLAFGMALHPATIAALLLEMDGDDRFAAESPAMAVSHAPPELLEACVRLLRLLDRPQDAAMLRPMIEREILWRLLTGGHGAMLRQIGLADSRLSQVGRAIRWIRTHYAEIFRIEDLARVAGMSTTSLHRHFRGVTTMSPLQFQKQIRLQEARARLLAAAEDVASVGFSVGYDSPSQFSREYRRLFGAPPGRDAARLRQIPALERSVT